MKPLSPSSCARISAATGRPRASAWTASSRRAAALPVGAASATSGAAAPAAAACSASSATMRATIVVFPVPGPPATTANRRSTAAAAASRWLPSHGGANSRARPSPSTPSRTPSAGCGREAGEVGREPALLAPVAVEVEARAEQPQRPVVLLARRHQPARAQCRDPRLGLRPRQLGQVDGLLGLDGGRVAHGREIDVDVAEPRRAHGERGGQRHLRRDAAAQRRQPAGDVHVGRPEHAGVVERAQQPRRLARAPDVVAVLDHAPLPWSSASLSVATSPGGGRQAKTPHGSPSTTGVCAPVIPRRNR